MSHRAVPSRIWAAISLGDPRRRKGQSRTSSTEMAAPSSAHWATRAAPAASRSSLMVTCCTSTWKRRVSTRSPAIARTCSRRRSRPSALKWVRLGPERRTENPVKPTTSAWRAPISRSRWLPPPTRIGTGVRGWRPHPMLRQAVVAPFHRDRVAAQQGSENGDGLLEAVEALSDGGQGHPDGVVLARGVARADPEGEAAARDRLEHGCLRCQLRRVSQPVVEHHRREGHPLRDGRRRGERHHRVLGAVDEVIGDADLVEAHRLDAAAIVGPATGIAGQQVDAESRTHAADRSATV